jgi:hypothetical protein
MEEIKNLVKEHLLKEKVISQDDYINSSYYQDIEWRAYKETDDTLLYVSYELTDGGIGYAFCVKVQCKRMKYNIDCFFYTKSFSNSVYGEWDDCPQQTQDKLLSDTINYFNIYKL